MSTLIGIVTYGNAAFTRLAVVEILKTVKRPAAILLVAAKPGDHETVALADEFHLARLTQEVNKGFPASINDIYDWAWKAAPPDRRYDNIIIMGNDVVPYPNAIDALIEQAEISDYEWISSCQFDVKSLVDRYPAARQYFKGPAFEFTDFSSRPWDLHGPENVRPRRVEDGVIKDVHNLCLYKRSVFEKIGYVDVNFYPAYFSDNDYCMRGWKEGLKTCSLDHSAYFHFWSRTIHQGGETPLTPRMFDYNSAFYRIKWGGPVQAELWETPFDGRDHELAPGIVLAGSRMIGGRKDEAAIVDFWKRKGGIK